jgi:fatty acid desaturase
MSGAGARPAAAYTWEKMRSALDSGKVPGYDESPELGATDLSWGRFLLILFAHGWFVRPKAFPLGRPDDTPSANTGKMMRRVYAFAAAWCVAILALPATWVVVAIVAWSLILIPGLVEIHQQFQNEPESDTGSVS